MINQTLYIIQGPPGSGKSFISSMLCNGLKSCFHDVVVYSTDDFFMEDGIYNFSAALLPEHHKSNFEWTCVALKQGKSVIVDNTNIHRWNCRDYVEFAAANSIPVVFIRVTGNYKNIHGVPDKIVEKMKNEMEDLTVESVLKSKKPWE